MNQIIVMTIACCAFIYGLLLVIGVTLHDMQQIQARARQKQHPYARRYRQRPRVTAIVYMSYHLDNLEFALANLLTSHYRKLDIILVVPPPLFKSAHAKISHIKSGRSIRIYSNRDAQFSNAARKAYRHFGNGDIIAIFDDLHLPAPQTILKTVQYFNSHVAVVAYTNSLIVSSYSILGLFQKYRSFTSSLYQKALNGLGVYTPTQATGGIIYRRSAFLDLSPRESFASSSPHYASELTVLTPSAPSLRQLLKIQFAHQQLLLQTLQVNYLYAPLKKRLASVVLLFAKIVAVVAPLGIGYCIFIALHLYQPLFLLIILLLYFSILFVAVVENEALRLAQKIFYIVMSPITLIAAYFLSIFQSWNTLRNFIRLQPVIALLRKQI
jgi:hypothetical protein